MAGDQIGIYLSRILLSAERLDHVEDAGLPRVNGEGAVSQLPPPVLGREGAVVELLGACLGAADSRRGRRGHRLAESSSEDAGELHFVTRNVELTIILEGFLNETTSKMSN